jgi:hypothetical protein
MHQPNFLPWIGFFDKMAKADVFVLLDAVELPSGGSWANRTQIKTPDGVQYLTLPIHASRGKVYNEVYPAIDERGFEKLWKTIHHNYARAPHYRCFARFIQDWLRSCKDSSLAGINYPLIIYLAQCLWLDTKIVSQTSLGLTETHKNDLIINLCKHFDCDVYLSGQGARAYNDEEKLNRYGIELRYQEFECHEYPQLWGDFVPNLSAIDVLFNVGGDAADLIGA